MPTKAQIRYQWDKVVGEGGRHIVELAAALPQNSPLLSEMMLKSVFQDKSLQLFLNSTVAKVGAGDVSSNLRFKNDKYVNNAVVKNTLVMLEFYRKLNTNPVVVTSYPRHQRVYSFKMNEDGSVDVKNSVSGEREKDKEFILTEFFKSMSLNLNRRQKMRMSSEGAHFYTYLADLLSLITQIDYYHHPEMFEEVVLSPDVVNTGSVENYESLEETPCKYRLTKVEKNGKTWSPKEDFDYLYFTTVKSESGQYYMVPKEGAINKVNHQMWELLSQGDNGTKKMVRDHFLNVEKFHRWSDYSVNDVDDGITMVAIAFAFNDDNPRMPLEVGIKEQFSKIVNKWYQDLDQE